MQYYITETSDERTNFFRKNAVNGYIVRQGEAAC